MVKYKVVKQTGKLVTLDINQDPETGSNQFVEKYKGMAVVLNAKTSKVAQELQVEHNGKYALKY